MPQSCVQPHSTLFSIRAARSFQNLLLVPVEGTRNELFWQAKHIQHCGASEVTLKSGNIWIPYRRNHHLHPGVGQHRERNHGKDL